MLVLTGAKELDCHVALVGLEVGHGVEGVEEPLGVTVGLALVDHLGSG